MPPPRSARASCPFNECTRIPAELVSEERADHRRPWRRQCVHKMNEHRSAITPAPYAKLKGVYQSGLKRETGEHQENDEPLGMTAKSFGRYLSTLAKGQTPNGRILDDPIDPMYGLPFDPSTLRPVATARRQVFPGRGTAISC